MAKHITYEGLQAVLQLIKQDVKTVDDKIEAIQIPSIEGLATEAFVNEKVAAILGADDLAEDLNSLKEVIDLLKQDGADILALQTAINAKVDKEDGKGLISLAEIERLAGVHNYDDSALVQRVETLEAIDHSQYLTEHQDIRGKVDKVNGKSLIDDAEIARLAQVHNYDDAALAGRVGALEAIDHNAFLKAADIEGKVDKEEGKSLIADTEIARLAAVDNYDDAEVRGLIAGKADASHEHEPAEIKFADGQSLQDKVDNGTFKGDKGDAGEQGPQGIQGEQGPQGAAGPAGADGVGIETVKIEYVEGVPHVKVAYDDVEATVQDAGPLDLNQITEYVKLKALVAKLESQLNSTCPFGDCVWIDAEYKQTGMGAYIASPMMQKEMNEDEQGFTERALAGAYELYLVATSNMKDYDRYYDTMIPMKNTDQQLGSEIIKVLGQMSPWVQNATWTFAGEPGKEIKLNGATDTPCIFVAVRRF